MPTSAGPLFVPNTNLTLTRGAAPAGTFTPMYAEDYTAKTIGQAADPDSEWRYSIFTDERSLSGTTSLKMGMPRGYPAPSCGGNHFFGNNHGMSEPLGLPVAIPIGKTIWLRVYFYFASTFSFGYVHNDSTEAAECGKSADMGLTGVKWLNFGPGKVYTKIPSGFRKVEQPTAAAGDPEYPDIRIENEGGGTGLSGSGRPIPLDRWFSLQMAAKVAPRGSTDGFVRLWLDDEMIAEELNCPTLRDGATELASWGVGDYWNSVPWTDGAPGRDDLYLDEIMIASDVAGYGAPTGIDANGNAYIATTTLAGDFA